MLVFECLVSEKNHASGTITVTGDPLDVALNGNGYFMLETLKATKFTRGMARLPETVMAC